MAKPFEVAIEQELDATPEQAWEAITTGAGMDGWFMGTSEVEPRLGGTLRTALPGFTMESTITAWDPPHRFVNTSPEAPDGRLMAFEFIIEGRAGGTTLLRCVHSGFLPDDVWDGEFEALKKGDPAYIFKLAEYLKFFRGRRAVPVSAWGAQIGADRAWSAFQGALGVGPDVTVGDPVHAVLEGLPPLDGVVDYRTTDFLGVRTDDGIYRFIAAMGSTAIGHHIYADVDPAATQTAWEAWLQGLFTAAGVV
ncbi:MAG TPA: SRPBCC domain-containing protein [Candidatus Saccharimonadia bacterium]|nr:SRPBCC domain-containing protein [Candidatus Saccharimonadia bacterium]